MRESDRRCRRRSITNCVKIEMKESFGGEGGKVQWARRTGELSSNEGTILAACFLQGQQIS